MEAAYHTPENNGVDENPLYSLLWIWELIPRDLREELRGLHETQNMHLKEWTREEETKAAVSVFIDPPA